MCAICQCAARVNRKKRRMKQKMKKRERATYLTDWTHKNASYDTSSHGLFSKHPTNDDPYYGEACAQQCFVRLFPRLRIKLYTSSPPKQLLLEVKWTSSTKPDGSIPWPTYCKYISNSIEKTLVLLVAVFQRCNGWLVLQVQWLTNPPRPSVSQSVSDTVV